MNVIKAKLCHKITVVKGNEKTVIKISLDDDCNNGHADFSLTADIYEKGKGDNWHCVGGGCCHEHILKLRPDLKIFADLHLSDKYGVPLHCFGNALYWFAGCFSSGLGQTYHGGNGSGGKTKVECRKIFIDYLRISEDEANQLFKLKPETAEILQYYCEEMNLPARWRKEAQDAIKILEMLSGKQWDHEYIPTRIRYNALSDERKLEIVKMIEGGHFSEEAKEQRILQKQIDESDRKRKCIIETYEANLNALKSALALDLEMNRIGVTENYIYYQHTNKVSINWTTTRKSCSSEDFEKLKSLINYSAISEGIEFEFNEKPKN